METQAVTPCPPGQLEIPCPRTLLTASARSNARRSGKVVPYKGLLDEAIRLLEQSGLLGRAGRKRLAVRLPTLESASRSISAALQMHRVTFKDLWEVSMGLEPLAARLACATIDDTHKLLLAPWAPTVSLGHIASHVNLRALNRSNAIQKGGGFPRLLHIQLALDPAAPTV